MTVVLDASLLTRSLAPSQLLAEAIAETTRLFSSAAHIVAPGLLGLELGTTLRRLETRALLSPGERASAWARFRRAPIEFRWDQAWAARSLEIAIAAGLSKLYDCAYVAAAEDLDAELVTCDARLVRAVSGHTTASLRLIAPIP